MTRIDGSGDSRQQDLPRSRETSSSAGYTLWFLLTASVLSGIVGVGIGMIASGLVRDRNGTASRAIEHSLSDVTNESLIVPEIHTAPAPVHEPSQGHVSQASYVASGNIRIAEEIAKALQAAKFGGYSIEIQFQEGTATIKGRVRSEEERARISQICLSIRGVHSVDNQVRCDPEAGSAKAEGVTETVHSSDSP